MAREPGDHRIRQGSNLERIGGDFQPEQQRGQAVPPFQVGGVERAEAAASGFANDEMTCLEDARRAIAKAKGD